MRNRSNYSNRSIKRKRSLYIRKLLTCAFSMVIICMFVFISTTDAANAKDEPANPTYKYYKSVYIEQGDTLWSIAKEHKNDETTQAYINELKEINNLTSDNIEDCKHLMVAYYDNEFK
ncbi:MAG: LysM peptidoglycan-binding domain-containing protein [Suipraeoptans sp.]